MSICDGCIHDEVCGLEDNHEEGIVSCADMIPKDVLNKIREEIRDLRYSGGIPTAEICGYIKCLEIIDKYRERSDKE